MERERDTEREREGKKHKSKHTADFINLAMLQKG